MNGWALIVEFLKVVLSPQVIIGLLALVFICKFKPDIKRLMSRIASIRFPGGEVHASQSEREAVAIETARSLPAQPSVAEEIPEGPNLSPQEVEKVKAFIQATVANAALWEYRYLVLFLVPHTQRVLDWIAQQPRGTALSLYDSIWMPHIPDANERRAVISALQAHNLIVVAGDFVEITDKGREYLNWRGPLPR